MRPVGVSGPAAGPTLASVTEPQEFTDADLSGARFSNVDLSGARLRNVDLTGASIRGALLVDVELDGEVDGLTVNGVDVTAYVESELDRRHPGRDRMRPQDAEGYREAWAVLQELWPGTEERALALPEGMLHRRVDGEWSFTETVRHLVFVVDAWLKRAVLHDEDPYHPWVRPHDEMPLEAGVAWDPDARPDPVEVLAVWTDRRAEVSRFLAGLTDEQLAAETRPPDTPGYPLHGAYAVSRCLTAVVAETWAHRLIAERDLAALEQHG